MAKARGPASGMPTPEDMNRMAEEATRRSVPDEYIGPVRIDHSGYSQSASQDTDQSKGFPSENNLYSSPPQRIPDMGGSSNRKVQVENREAKRKRMPKESKIKRYKYSYKELKPFKRDKP